jgi:hypothetical protein
LFKFFIFRFFEQEHAEGCQLEGSSNDSLATLFNSLSFRAFCAFRGLNCVKHKKNRKPSAKPLLSSQGAYIRENEEFFTATSFAKATAGQEDAKCAKLNKKIDRV